MYSTLPKTPALLRSTPVPPHLFLPKGMLIPEEQILFYLLARDVYQGEGEIVDAGAFCGTSAYCFAAGLTDSTGSYRRCQRINSYDLFELDDAYTLQYIQNNFYYYTDLEGNKRFLKTQAKPGDSFKDIFEFQTQRYAHLISINAGSILDFPWDGRPIEILFIDVAKTLDIQKHLFSSYFPSLLAGCGFLVQQDFHHAYHPYIHVAMEYLADFFEITHSAVGASRMYRLLHPVPRAVLQRVIDYDFSNDEVFELMRRCVEKSPPAERALLNIAFARHLMTNGDARLDGVLQHIASTYGNLPAFDWYRQEMKAAVGTVAVEFLARIGL
ncbi:hypothetical protein [Solidesulfovibrio sp.]